MENSSNSIKDETESKKEQEDEEVVQNLIKQGKYDEVLKYLNAKPLDIDIKDKDNEDFKPFDQDDLIPANDISLSNKTPEEENESQQSILINPYDNGYEALLDDNKKEINNEEEKKEENIDTEKKENNINFYNFESKEKDNENVKNLEMLTKELEELEQYEKEDKNNLEQMNEMYQMIQEDQLSLKLQADTRLKLFPNYLRANSNFNQELKSDLFTNIQLMRNCYISTFIIKPTKDNSKEQFSIKSPPSIFESLEYENSDIKSKENFEEQLLDYMNEKNVKIENSMNEIYNEFTTIKNNMRLKKNNKETIIINLESGHYNDYLLKKEEIPQLISNKVKLWIKTDNINSDNNTDKYNNESLSKFNNLFLQSFGVPVKNNPNPLLELTLVNQGLKEIPGELLKESPQLRFLNLDENQIEKISHLDNLTKLYSLNLNKNLIKKIENISQLVSLEKLSLNYNLIEQIENCEHNSRLKFFSIGKNNIHSIESIENQLLYIEVLILCENNIKFLPENFSLPYLKFLDLNENKISQIDNFLYCPCLEKLLLIDNKIVGEGTKPIFKYCNRLKEIDLSFNKIEYLSFVLGMLRYNENLEIINVRNNPFIMNGMKFSKIYLQKLFPKLKIINLDNLKDNNTTGVKLITKRKKENKKYMFYIAKNYFNIFLLQTYFMKFFNSVYFTNKIHGVFNFNINTNLNEEIAPLLDIVNTNHFLFKQNHLKLLSAYFDKKCISFSDYVQSQNQLLNYLYDFKHKMIYIKNSMGIFSKNLTLRLLKIQKIQQLWKMIMVRKKLKEIKFVDEDKENCDDLLGFFSTEKKDESPDLDIDFKWEAKKIEEIEQNLQKLSSKQKSQQPLETINENQNENDNENNMNKSKEEPPIIEHKEEKKSDSQSLLSERTESQKNDIIALKHIDNNFGTQDYLRKSINDLTRSKHLTPLKQVNFPQPNNNEIASVINNLNPNAPSTPNTLNTASDFNLSKTRYYPQVPCKYKQGDNIHLRYVNMNNQMMLPSLSKIPSNKKNIFNRPESNIVLPSIKHTMDISSVNNEDSKSVKSNYSINSKFSTIKGRMLPQKTIEAIRLLEEECKAKIQKAKEEWGFNNQQTDYLLAKKIKKTYQKKINKLLANNN